MDSQALTIFASLVQRAIVSNLIALAESWLMGLRFRFSIRNKTSGLIILTGPLTESLLLD